MTYNALRVAVTQPVRDAMDLAYLTAQRPADVLRMDVRDIRDGMLHVKRRIEVSGDLTAVIERIAARKRGMVLHSTRLVVNEKGKPLTYSALVQRFAKARTQVGLTPEELQFRDLRAKGGTDTADSTGDMRKARDQLGHRSMAMAEHYVKNRRGTVVKPTR